MLFVSKSGTKKINNFALSFHTLGLFSIWYFNKYIKICILQFLLPNFPISKSSGNLKESLVPKLENRPHKKETEDSIHWASLMAT